MAMTEAPYPVQFSVDYPEKPLDRLSTFFRIIAIIPIAILLILVSSSVFALGDYVISLGGIGTLFLPVLLTILFRLKYPRWWFDWNVALLRFCTRVGVYWSLLRDEYPSTDEEQAVHLDIAYPDAAKELNRWLPLVKWLLALPHYIVLVFLALASIVIVIISWFAILFTGRYPRGLFDLVVGITRWALRVEAYALLLVTDRYPPFRLDP